MQAIVHPGCGLRPLAPRPPAHRRGRAQLAVVAAKAAKPAPPPAEAPAAPTDIPSYFQPAPPPSAEQAQVYQAVPAGPQYVAPPPEPSFWGKIPPLVYIGVGVVLAGVLGKVMELVKGGPQKMQEIAMQQMMKQMMKQMGSAQGGANPFGAPGANPFGAPGANPFGAPGANPFGAAPPSGFPGSFPSAPVFDTTAQPAPPAAAASSSTAAPAAASRPAAESSSSGSATEAKPKKRSAFTDVNVGSTGGSAAASAAAPAAEPAAAAAAPPGAAAGMPPPPFSMPPPPPSGGAAGGTGATGVAGTMLDMLKNPEMQKMLYPYLPEPMRNPETFEWMLSNPEYRQQLEGMLQQQVAASGSPAMQEMMAGMDMSPEKMQAQFDALGMTPDQFIQKVMGDPDLSQMMTNPKVMAAIAECTKNPMAIMNYQSDPEVMKVFEKMATLFPGAGGGMPPGMGMGMPPGFGGMPTPPPQQ